MSYNLLVECKDWFKMIPIANKNGELIYKTNIENFDMVTAQYEDETDFLIAMVKKGRLDCELVGKKLFILGTDKKAVKKRVVFNSKLLKSSAIELYNERKKGRYLKDIHLSKTEELLILARELKACALINDKELKQINSSYISLPIKKELTTYVRLKEKEQLDTSESTDLHKISYNIENYLTNYALLRDVIIWEQQKMMYLERLKEKNDSENNAIEGLTSEEIKEIPEKELQSIADEQKKKREALYREIEDEKLRELYEQGGLAEVFDMMDTNRLYAEKNEEDRIAMGIPTYKKIKST